MAETLTPSRVIAESGLDGEQTGFPEGVDSFSHPLYVRSTQLRWMENASVEGAFPQVRPGYKTQLELKTTDGSDFALWWLAAGQPLIHPQMMEEFIPSGGLPQLVFAVSGSVWWATISYDGTLESPKQITTLFFSANADQLTGTRCTQTATIVSGSYANNIIPRNLIVIQDGVNKAGIWDGLLGQTMNPVKKITTDDLGNTFYTNGYNETRIGLWCAWSGNRLWVFSGRLGFASDLGDPTHFTEELTLNSGQVFVFPETVTGAIDRGTSGTTRSQVVVTTSKTVWTLWSGIQARLPSATAAGWAYTPDFMVKIFGGVGCVAGKSLVLHRGLLYWKSLEGLVLFDSTGTVNSTQNLPIIDQEMAYSKRRTVPALHTNGDLTCAGVRGSVVMWSVPVGATTNGRCYNAHTQVLDRQTTVVRSVGLDGPFSYGTTGWQGIWTGIRPVAWASSVTGSSDHTYALSMDTDGVVRIWEAFQGNRADNGHPIPWLVETRLHRMAPQSIFDYCNFRHFRVLIDQIKGNLTFSGSWRGMRSRYHEILNIPITATPGSVLVPGLAKSTPFTNDTVSANYTLQNRTVISPDVRNQDGLCQATNVESQYQDGKDHAFSLLFKLTGRGAISAYRIAADQVPDQTEGQATNNTGVVETGYNIVSPSQCPEHIDGTTPTYVLADTPSSQSFSPYQPDSVELDPYSSPVT